MERLRHRPACLKEPPREARRANSSRPRRSFSRSPNSGKADGWVNLARVYQREGRIPEALAALEKAAAHKKPAAPWVINWLTGQINASNDQLEEAVASFETVLKTRIPERKFDFGLDFVVNNEMASALYTGSARDEEEPRAA